MLFHVINVKFSIREADLTEQASGQGVQAAGQGVQAAGQGVQAAW